MPYLLTWMVKNDMIWLPNLVWAIDITYIKMGKSHMYLTAIIDWHSRFIVGYELSDTLEAAPVLDLVKRSIAKYGVPAILNSDQGSQFTSLDYMDFLKNAKIRQSMDGKGRWIDNVIIERWFRSLKVERIYIYDYQTPRELRNGLDEFITRYNTIRPHLHLDDGTPFSVYTSCFN